MTYFINRPDKNINKLLISRRSRRVMSLSLVNFNYIVAGDILSIAFWKAAKAYKFEGICLAVRKKSLSLLNTTVILRNVIFRVGIEMTISFFLHHFYTCRVLDYQRKQFLYKKSKIYYVRTRLNKASRIK